MTRNYVFGITIVFLAVVTLRVAVGAVRADSTSADWMLLLYEATLFAFACVYWASTS